MLVSVIVPVYNAERYIEMCASSILAQSYEDIELILVDDGSKDNSSKICDAIAERDNRVKVLHQKNGGVSAARNSGIKIAQGEYIAFVDNDDLMPVKAIEMMISAANEKHPLVIQGEVLVRSDYSDLSTEIEVDNHRVKYVGINDFVLRSGVSRTDVWGKLYSRKLAVKHLFPQGHYGEDLYFNGMVLSDSDVFEVAVVDKPVYIHFDNNESASHKWISRDFADIADTVYDLYLNIKKTCSNDKIVNVYFKLVFTQFASMKYNIILRDDYRGELKSRMRKIKNNILKELSKSTLSTKEKIIYYVLVNFNSLYRVYIVRRDPTMKLYEKNVKDETKNKQNI